MLHEVGPVQLERGPEALQLEVAFEESLEVRFGHLDALDLLERDGQLTEQRAELNAVLLPEALDRAFRRVDEWITHSDTPFGGRCRPDVSVDVVVSLEGLFVGP